MNLFTAAVLLFSIGQVMQYRLFTDPEYSARRMDRSDCQDDTLRQRYINDYYDADKKRALFGDTNFRIPITPGGDSDDDYWTLKRVISSLSTLIPLVALLGFGLAFLLTKRDDVLLWLQRHSFFVGMATTIPFALMAILFSSRGKFLGATTPWEPVKITFLISFAGILADHYRDLSRTYWGIPPLRFLLPFLIVALLRVVPFFALSDFREMLVFFGAYLTLYLVGDYADCPR